jgi:cyclohexyl-isocyanide hydratase
VSAAISIAMVVFPKITLLDLVGPHEVFTRMPGARVRLVAHSLEPIRSDAGVAITPDAIFEDCPPLDVLFVPGGAGQFEMMEDARLMAFLRERGAVAQWVTSVCTGSLLLAAAGLLRGYRATCHWMSLPLLEPLGAIPVTERVVEDRNRLTGAGISAGIDLGLALSARVCGDETARAIQLSIEYDPQPPFECGSPRVADPELVERVRAGRREFQNKRREQVLRIAGDVLAASVSRD